MRLGMVAAVCAAAGMVAAVCPTRGSVVVAAGVPRGGTVRAATVVVAGRAGGRGPAGVVDAARTNVGVSDVSGSPCGGVTRRQQRDEGRGGRGQDCVAK